MNFELVQEPYEKLNNFYDTVRYYYQDVWDSTSDPRVNRFPFMSGGPWSIIGIIIGYVYFVKVLGPEWMEKRKPFDLRRPILFYNLFMVLVNGYFFAVASFHTSFGLKTWTCYPPDPNAFDPEWRWKLQIAWFFLISKFIDLFDTIFFVLRKKNNQISALHVIHHSLVPINCWLGFKYVPSETAAFMPFVNSFVHCIMYLYYALSTLGPSFKPYLWWKKYLTQLQIIQLFFIALHCVYICFIPACNIPKIFFLIACPQTALILFMFCSFFSKNYTKINGFKKIK